MSKERFKIRSINGGFTYNTRLFSVRSKNQNEFPEQFSFPLTNVSSTSVFLYPSVQQKVSNYRSAATEHFSDRSVLSQSILFFLDPVLPVPTFKKYQDVQIYDVIYILYYHKP